MVEVRPMTADEAPACVRISHDAFTEMRTRYGLPVIDSTPERTAREVGRLKRFVATDPDGCVVAESGEGVVGFGQAIVRDGLWHLSLLAVAPGWQDRSVGRVLLDATLAYGADGPGMILASRDPRASRRYAAAGFDLHPAMTAWGRVDPRGLPAAPDVRPGCRDDAALVDAVDRAVRGASRAADVMALVDDEGGDLLVIDGRGWVVVTGARPYALAALDKGAAGQLLAAALARAPEGETAEVGWLTAGHGWAVEVALAARLELHPVGPFFVRGLPAPFPLSLACGSFG